jgi:Tfp pilus assembly protein PilO
VKFRGEIWRQRLWVWLPALLFFLANVGAFAVYKLGYAGRVESLQDQLDTQRQTLGQLASQQRASQAMLTRVQTNGQQVVQLYADRLSPRSRRLTAITTEVKAMAKKAGLEPRSLSYPEEEIQKFSLIKRSFIFSVKGTYSELRQFISQLEASRSFLSLDQVTVNSNDSSGAELSISLKLSTLFARGTEEGVPAPADPSLNGAAAVSPAPAPGSASGGTP